MGTLTTVVVAIGIVVLAPILYETARLLSYASLLGLYVVPAVQFAAGYILGHLLKQPRPVRLSMALELGLRDAPLAGTPLSWHVYHLSTTIA